MKRALVQGTRICEFVATVADQFPVHESMVWVNVPNNTTTQDTYENGMVVKYVDPVPGPLQAIASLEAQITQRRLREATLTDEGKAWLQDIEDQIAIERVKL